MVEDCCVARHCAKFSRNLIHSRVNPVPKLEEEEEEVVINETETGIKVSFRFHKPVHVTYHVLAKTVLSRLWETQGDITYDRLKTCHKVCAKGKT